ncbi:MAG: hypothetical protein OXJ52_03660 [Oligoflexia bacterium]|nr:hypothetical protein [Oligoflexia bacterium]
MTKITLILSSWLIASFAGAYIDYTGKYRPVIDLGKNKFNLKITQLNHYQYKSVYNITIPFHVYLPEYRASDQPFCQQALEALSADRTRCQEKYPNFSDTNRIKCLGRAERKYPGKCITFQGLDLFINVLTANGKTKKFKENPETAPVTTIDLIAYDNGEKSISPSNAGYPKVNRVVMGQGGDTWSALFRLNRKNYYCIWARITLPTKTSHMAHMSEILIDFQKKISDGSITLPGDFTAISQIYSWENSLGDWQSPRRIQIRDTRPKCAEDLRTRTANWPAISLNERYSKCDFPVSSKLRRQFILEDFIASKGSGHNRKYFRDDQVAPIYLRIVREGNLSCRTNPWINPHVGSSYLRDFPLKTTL